MAQELTTQELVNLVDKKWEETRKANKMAKKILTHNFPHVYFGQFLSSQGVRNEDADRKYVVRTLTLCGVDAKLAERYFDENIKDNVIHYKKKGE